MGEETLVDGKVTPAPEKPAWIAQLPDDLKANETFTPYKTIGDFGKSHLEMVGKIKELDGVSAKTKELEGRLANSIPKLPENATDEEREVFWASLGKPETVDGYEFPKDDGIAQDKEMDSWARATFHKLNLSKEQGMLMAQEWNALVKEVNKRAIEAKKIEIGDSATKLKAELGDGYDAGIELATRLWKKHTDGDFDKAFDKETNENRHQIVRYIIKMAKLTGEDTSPKGAEFRGIGTEVREGIQYKDMEKFKGG